MKLATYYYLLAAGSAVAATPFGRKLQAESTPPSVPTNRFIIEVDSIINIPNKRAFARPLDAVYDSIRARDVEFDINEEYNTKGLFVGASITLSSAHGATEVNAIPGVKAIYPIKVFRRPEVTTREILPGQSDPTAASSSVSWTHESTGIDKVHARGLFGKGVKIGIIDTGVDYTHPSLGGGIGLGKKIVGGYDFVGNNYDGTNTPRPDSDPLDKCSGHGTHVAGIIAADPNNPYNITGVAPKVSITVYRIFGCGGFTTDEIIVAALLKGLEDGQDVLNLSLGSPDGWSSSVSGMVASRIARSGKIVTVAAGDDGQAGLWYSSSPANGADVITVGSVENIIIPTHRTRLINIIGADHAPISYQPPKLTSMDGAFPIYVTSPDIKAYADACFPLPNDTPDLSPYVVVIRKSAYCIVSDQILLIRAKGARRALLDEDGDWWNPEYELEGADGFPVAVIPEVDGQFLVQQFFAGTPIKLSFSEEDTLTSNPNSRGGLMSTFSTYGPSNDFNMKPALSAPGGNILSLFPVALGSYAVMSGTSMASAFVAGSAALLLEGKGKSFSTAREARSLLQATARSVPSGLETGVSPQTVTQQGAGLIDIYGALFSTTSVSEGALILNDSAYFELGHTFVVKNNGNESKEYAVTHIPAGTILSVAENSIFTSVDPVPRVDDAAKVLMIPSQFALAPGESQTVATTFEQPESLDSSRYPVYSGFIQITSPGENLHVAYLGLAASLKDKQVLDDTDAAFGEKLPALALRVEGGIQVGHHNYTFIGFDYPTLVYRMAFGSPLVRLDLIDPQIPNSPGTLNDSSSSAGAPSSPSGFTILGPLLELNNVGRNSENKTDPDRGNAVREWTMEHPKFPNGSTIADGVYRFLLRALKVTGDPSKEEDYDSWISPTIGIMPQIPSEEST